MKPAPTLTTLTMAAIPDVGGLVELYEHPKK